MPFKVTSADTELKKIDVPPVLAKSVITEILGDDLRL
jgi:hypothetical protein